MVSNLRLRRLRQELKELKLSPPDNCWGDAVANNINKWRATILGPHDSPYENGIFHLTLEFGENYPFVPPSCKFSTYIYHPNIDKYGNICLDILKQNWTPAISVSKLLISICSLLDDPNPDDPLDADISRVYKTDIEEFKRKAKEMTRLYT